jgi:hypothetical protein
MALVQATLATELEAMVHTDTEAAAISNFATAFDNYFQGASVLGTPVTGSTAAAKAAMIGAMTGLSTTGAAAITAGITAYWGVITPAVATIWVLVPPLVSATPPPTLAAITAALTATFTANKDASLSLSASAAAVAANIHTNQLGGIAIQSTLPSPTPQPIL